MGKRTEKRFWYRPVRWEKGLVTAAIESGFDAIAVSDEDVARTKALASIPVIASGKDADMVLGKDVIEILVDSKEKEKEAASYEGKIPVIVKNKDWTIIPLENLLSKTKNIIQHVRTCDEAKVALETLEVGADGILLETDSIEEIVKARSLIHGSYNEHLKLVEARIVSVKPVGIGDRVIIDTASLLPQGQGMLIGDSSRALFLVHNENVPSTYADPRPFRVNAGGAHAYVRMPGDRTKYISELMSGSSVLVVDKDGNTDRAIVGRVKIEKRPMLLVVAEVGNTRFTLVMQNAETIRLTSPAGEPLSITALKQGDVVLSYHESAVSGRHFGQRIVETIQEK